MTMTIFINLTPHAINIAVEPPQTVLPSGALARCAEVKAPAGAIDGIPVNYLELGEVTGLPDPQPDTFYLVSALVRTAVPSRTDLLSPGTLIRDEKGQIIGCGDLVANRAR